MTFQAWWSCGPSDLGGGFLYVFNGAVDNLQAYRGEGNVLSLDFPCLCLSPHVDIKFTHLRILSAHLQFRD